MLVLTKKPPTNAKRQAVKSSVHTKKNAESMLFFVSCPASSSKQIKQYLEKHGCVFLDEGQEWVDAKGLFAERTPANMLIGARGKESITQMQLSELTGIPRRHISDMENGRRSIGKQNAMKFGKALNINYRLFL
jgi:DNA-binding XRE family transcriptional regulator